MWTLITVVRLGQSSRHEIVALIRIYWNSLRAFNQTTNETHVSCDRWSLLLPSKLLIQGGTKNVKIINNPMRTKNGSFVLGKDFEVSELFAHEEIFMLG